MYINFINIYNTPANLFIIKRLKRKNTLTLTFKLYENNFENVVKALKSGLARLNKNISIKIKNKKIFIYVLR